MTYDKYADEYDQRYKSATSQMENALIKAKLLEHGIDKAKEILDFGCGTGFLLDLMDVQAANYVGLDVSKKMIELARKKHPCKFFLEKDAGTLKYRKVDTVVSLFSIPYIGVAGVRSAYRHLKPYGIFFCVYYAKPYKSPDSVYYKKPLKYKMLVAPKVKKVMAECDRLFELIDSAPIGEGYWLSVYRRNEK